MNRTALTFLLIGAVAAVVGLGAYDWRLGSILAGLLAAAAGIAALDVDEQGEQ